MFGGHLHKSEPKLVNPNSTERYIDFFRLYKTIQVYTIHIHCPVLSDLPKNTRENKTYAGQPKFPNVRFLQHEQDFH